MFCRHCGKEIVADSTFCPVCGGVQGDVPQTGSTDEKQAESVVAAPDPVVEPIPEPEPVVVPTPEPEPVLEESPNVVVDAPEPLPPSDPEPIKTGRKPTTMVAAILVVVILLSATLGWYFLVYNKDSDGDGHPDREDAFPDMESEWLDSDHDGWGDNGDAFPDDLTEWSDLDSDGVGDNTDLFPEDPLDWIDSDADGVGDNTDPFPNNKDEWLDTDEDGVGDNQDEFPMDPTEWTDTDDDGVGDNGDAFPDDVTEWADTDGDGRGDNSDLFPTDADEWADNDEDGTGDNADPDDDNDYILDRDDLFPKENAIMVITIQQFTLLDPIDYDSFGQIWIEIDVERFTTYRIPEAGYQQCEINVVWDVQISITFDVPDDQAVWTIAITAMDRDDFFDDYVDLSPAGTKVLYLTWDIQTNTLSGDVTSFEADGSGDGTGASDDDDGRISFNIVTEFE